MGRRLGTGTARPRPQMDAPLAHNETSVMTTDTQRAFVTSADGTQIAYDSTGTGPGLVVLSGSVVPPHQYGRLAQALASAHRVHIVHRRGRGASGPQGGGYVFAKETEDAIAVLSATNSAVLFGHSLGALLALRTGLAAKPSVGLSAIIGYEPPVPVGDSLPMAFLPAFEAALAAGRPALALTLLQRGLQVGGTLDRLPPAIGRAVNAAMLATVGRDMKQTVHTVPAEARALSDLPGQADEYTALNVPTTLLVGQRSPAYFAHIAAQVTAVMANGHVETLEGLDHNGPLLKPTAVAEAVLRRSKASARA